MPKKAKTFKSVHKLAVFQGQFVTQKFPADGFDLALTCSKIIRYRFKK